MRWKTARVWPVMMVLFLSEVMSAGCWAANTPWTLVVQFDATPQTNLWLTLKDNLENKIAPELGPLQVFERSQIQTGQTFERLAIVHVRGSCLVRHGLVSSWRPAPLGWVDIMDGAYLPFINADCTRIMECVQRTMPFIYEQATPDVVAFVLSRVIRHELRHLAFKTATHTKTGDYQASFTGPQLVSGRNQVR